MNMTLSVGFARMYRMLVVGTLLMLASGLLADVHAMERVTFERDSRRVTVEGRVVVSGDEGGVLLEARNGSLWIITAEEVVERTADDRPFAPMDAAEQKAEILKELPQGFAVHDTQRYLIFHNTSSEYAQWCGSLLERLNFAFSNYWKGRGFEIEVPDRPLVVIVFADRRGFEQYSRPFLGDAVESMLAYYNIQSNRLVMFDMTGVSRAASGRGNMSSEIRRILSRPEASAMVATIVHEATHQLAFNNGLHERFSDTPRWLLEGMAVYFESPDVSNTKGWRTLGLVNRPRLVRFRNYAQRRPGNSLVTLVTTDDRLTNTSTALDAYAEAWAYIYFLIHRHPKEFIKYMQILSEKGPIATDTPEQRWADFTEAFGDDPASLDREFMRYIMQLN